MFDQMLVYPNWEWVYEKSLQPHLYKVYLSVGGYVLCCLLCLMLSQRKTQIYNNITLRYASLKEVSISGSNYAFLPVNWSSNGPGRQFPKQNLVWLSWDLPLLICTIATKLLLQRANLLLHHSVVKVFHFQLSWRRPHLPPGFLTPRLKADIIGKICVKILCKEIEKYDWS